jgi:hypothetical protein
MALHWDLGKIENRLEVCYYTIEANGEAAQYMKARTESLLFLTMLIGMNEITESNWREFYIRLNMYEQAIGAFFRKDGKAAYYTPLMVQQHIGLGTNASKLTKTQFEKKLLLRLREEAERNLDRESKSLQGVL